MSVGLSLVFALIAILQNSSCGPPQFEQNPQYSNSYLPAAMQVIAHLTETMKYELRPQPSQPPSTSTTSRPTPPHRPGVFQPNKPPPHRVYKSILTKKMNELSLGSIIRQYEPFLPAGLHELDLELLGEGAKDLHKAVNIEINNNFEDFLDTFDDDARYFNFLRLLTELRQRKTPPTRAYVTLLTLYDLFNKEAKRLALNHFNGYSEQLLKDLMKTSSGSSAYQLEYLLMKVQTRRETNDPMIDTKIMTILQDLTDEQSYLNVAMRDIPPLPFSFH